MVIVKLFGLFRLDTGIKELSADVPDVKSLYPLLMEKAREIDPNTRITKADIKGCIVIVNGKQIKKNKKLKDGDIVMMMPPVCGG